MDDTSNITLTEFEANLRHVMNTCRKLYPHPVDLHITVTYQPTPHGRPFCLRLQQGGPSSPVSEAVYSHTLQGGLEEIHNGLLAMVQARIALKQTEVETLRGLLPA